MITSDFIINSPASMINAIRECGFIPFFKCGIEGWSIEEMTDHEYWFTSSDKLGPWDWKIDAVREGNIAYGKFLGGAAGFATTDFYRHLMNYRRSLPQYRIVLGEDFQAVKQNELLMKALAPTAFNLIKKRGAVESREIRESLTSAVTPQLLDSVTPSCRANLFPAVKKSISDSVITFLEMGTWTVVADFIRLYRGRNQEYNGWQRSIITMPDELFEDSVMVDCSPEESRQFLISHLLKSFPDQIKRIEKII